MAKQLDQEIVIENKTESENTNGEVKLIDVIAVLWRYKFLIIGMTFAFAAYAVIYSVRSLMLPPDETYLPNVFTVDSDMLIKDTSSSSSLSSLLGSSASALAGLAGVSLGGGGSTNSALALYLISSRDFLDALIEEFDLYEKFAFDPEKVKSPRSTARDMVSKMVEATYDEDNGIFTVSCTNKDSQFAFDVVNFTVDYLEQKFLALGVDENQLSKKNLEDNIEACVKEIAHLQQETGEVERSVSNVYGPSSAEPISMKLSMIEIELAAQEEIYKQLKVQYELLKIDMASETPVFQILTRPEIPDRKSGPSRGKLCIVYTFVGGCLSVLISFSIEGFNHLKNDKTIAAKFKPRKRKKSSLFKRDRKAAPAIRLVRAHTQADGLVQEDTGQEDEPSGESLLPRDAKQRTGADDGANDPGDTIAGDDDGTSGGGDVDDTKQKDKAAPDRNDDRTQKDAAGDEKESAGDKMRDVPSATGRQSDPDVAQAVSKNEPKDEPSTEPQDEPKGTHKNEVRDDEKPKIPAPKLLPSRLPSGTVHPNVPITQSHESAPAKAVVQQQRPQRVQQPPAAVRTTKTVSSHQMENSGEIRRTVQPKPVLPSPEARVAPPVSLRSDVTPQRAVVRSETPKGEKADEAKKRGKKDEKKGDKKRGKKSDKD